MNVLGITLGHDTSFSLIENGLVKGIIEAERYFRQKRYKLHCITMVPGKHVSGYQYVDVNELRMFLSKVGTLWGKSYDAIAVQNQGRAEEFKNVAVLLRQEGFTYRNIYSVDHHLSHAALAYYTSPFEESLVLSYDGLGNDGYSIIFKAEGSIGIKYIKKSTIEFGRSYNNLGYLIGIKPEICGTTSGKVMGLTAYGDLRDDWMPFARKYVREYRKLPQLPVEGLNSYGKAHRINSIGLHDIPELVDYVFPAERVRPAGFFERVKRIGQPPAVQLQLNDLNNKLSMSLARTVQAAWTDEVLEMLRPHHKESKNLCIVGGCALNGITNYVIQKSGLFSKLHFVPNPSDCGLSAGAALYVDYQYGKTVFRGHSQYFSPYLGVEAFDLDDLPKLMCKYPSREFDQKDIARVLAEIINKDYIVGVIRGRYENGPRALGNRSILCNPLNKDMRDILNSKVKHREWYRPFAPLVTAEDAGKYFTSVDDIPYMSVICYTRTEYRNALPSITHVDGSARLQTIRKDQNILIYDVLKEFEKLSGFPIVLNTSFNPRGEPILNFCHVALEMLDKTDLDIVLIENVFFCKKGKEHFLDLKRNIV
jgi:carbamoyltransferase